MNSKAPKPPQRPKMLEKSRTYEGGFNAFFKVPLKHTKPPFFET